MGKDRILIVEDEVITATDLESQLKQLNYEVVGSILNGEEALEAAKQLQPNLILMDIFLKGTMTGIDVAKRLSYLIDIPIVYLTAYTDAATFNKAKTTMPYGYITKPFTKRDLQHTIELALCRYSMHTKLSNVERRYSLIMDYTSSSIMIINNKGIIVAVNKAGEALLQEKKTQLLGEKLIKFISPHDRVYAELIFAKGISEKRQSHAYVALREKSGQKRNCEISCVPFVEDDHKYLMCIINDKPISTVTNDNTVLNDKLLSINSLSDDIIDVLTAPFEKL